MNFEDVILCNLVSRRDYCAAVLPHLQPDYFEDLSRRRVFESFAAYTAERNAPPSMEALHILLEQRRDLSEDQYKEVNALLGGFKLDRDTELEWLVKQTEKHCQDRALFNAIRRGILVIDGQDKELDKGALPKLMQDALSVSFDTSVGHDFFEDFEERFEYYHREEERLPFDIDVFNDATRGGLPRKTLSLILAATGGGKSLVMCHMAAGHLMHGKNVLYITLELSEKEIAKRIDSNILDVTLPELDAMEHAVYTKRLERLKGKSGGNLVVQEYPVGSANVGHFRHLLNELKLKKSFEPDVIYVDYLNNCASSRIKGAATATVGTYTFVKAVAEELRALAMERNLPIVSASQYNRSGITASDVDLTNTSDSIAITFVADWILALIRTEELDEAGQILFKQLKSRYDDIARMKRFVVGVDRMKMKLYNLEPGAQRHVQAGEEETPAAFEKGRTKRRLGMADGIT